MDFIWQQTKEVNLAYVEELSKAINVNPYLSQVLVQRDIKTFEEAKDFFKPDITKLHDPFLMKDMDKAVARITLAIQNKENIMVYGDYDVDGTTSVALVYRFLNTYTQHLSYYVPDRFKEGYGISKQGIDTAHETGVTLLIALDCGIRAIEITAYAKSLGIEMIICDHHLPGAELPDAVAILDPKRKDCPYPYKELSGCGIGFKLVEAIAKSKGLPFESIDEYLDLVVVSIASDLVDVCGENRILAYYGLKRLNNSPRVGLQALIGEKPEGKYLNISDIVFTVGPKINAAGRMAHAKTAVELLICTDFKSAQKITQGLVKNNDERKETDSDITIDAIHRLENDVEYKNKKTTVIYGETWSKGVLGIVASRLVETFYKPTIVFCKNDDYLTGSARSIKDFDIHEAIGDCQEFVVQFGGHKYAAGLSIEAKHLDVFMEKFERITAERLTEKDLTPIIAYDVDLPPEAITDKFMQIMEQMEPFGPGNMAPIFRTQSVNEIRYPKLLNEKHIKLTVAAKNGKQYDAIGFGLADKFAPLLNNNKVDLCYCLEYNIFKGNKKVQMRLKDIKVAE